MSHTIQLEVQKYINSSHPQYKLIIKLLRKHLVIEAISKIPDDQALQKADEFKNNLKNLKEDFDEAFWATFPDFRGEVPAQVKIFFNDI